MKYEYKHATGTTEIEVDEHFYDLLVTMDDEEKNSNRKHSRRYPISLENCEYEGEWFEDKNDLIEETEAAIRWEQASASLTELQRLCFVLGKRLTVTILVPGDSVKTVSITEEADDSG